MFVRVKEKLEHSERKFGKLTFHDKRVATVEFFDNPTDYVDEVQIPLANLEQVELPKGTRVYIYDAGKDFYFVGSILKSEIDNRQVIGYEIQFEVSSVPPMPKATFLEPKELLVRESTTLNDHRSFLLQGLMKKKHFLIKVKYLKVALEQDTVERH